MKKLLFLLLVLVFFTGCKNDEQPEISTTQESALALSSPTPLPNENILTENNIDQTIFLMEVEGTQSIIHPWKVDCFLNAESCGEIAEPIYQGSSNDEFFPNLQGTMIVVMSVDNEEILVIDVENHQTQQLYQGMIETQNVFWSADGTKVALTHHIDQGQIYTVSEQGLVLSDQFTILNMDILGWSNEGKLILATYSNPENVPIIAYDSGAQNTLTILDKGAFPQKLIRNGSELFVSQNGQEWIFSLDTHTMTESPFLPTGIHTWSPDNRFILTTTKNETDRFTCDITVTDFSTQSSQEIIANIGSCIAIYFWLDDQTAIVQTDSLDFYLLTIEPIAFEKITLPPELSNVRWIKISP